MTMRKWPQAFKLYIGIIGKGCHSRVRNTLCSVHKLKQYNRGYGRLFVRLASRVCSVLLGSFKSFC